MPLPVDFSPAQHLLEMLIGTHNRSVQRTFLGVPDADLDHPLGGMKLACLLTPDDTVDMIILRLMLYWFEFKGDLPTPVYGLPTGDYQSEVTFRPQVILFFKEDWNAVVAENKLPRAEARISFRLMHETSATITPAYAQGLAVKVKEFFGQGTGFTWEKGTIKVVYRDIANGYDFRLLAESEGEAIKVIEKVLELNRSSLVESNLSVTKVKKTFPVVPPLAEIYGKERRKPRLRPITQVRFKSAELHIHGLPQPVVLIDMTGKKQALIFPT